jgi:hypothetical protein
MSLDAQAMLEVNRDLIFKAAKEQRQRGIEKPFVVSVATFGRGIKQEMLQALEPYRTAFGHNQSLVAAPPLEVAVHWLKQTPPAVDQGFAVLGYAFGKTVIQEWRWDEEDGDGFF